MNLRQTLIKSFFGVGSMYMLSIPVGLLTSIVLARTLGPAAFGQYAFMMSLLYLLVLPAAAGLPQLLTREVASFAHSGQWSLYRGVVRAAHVWVLMVAALLLAGYWLAGPMVGLIPQAGKWALLSIVVLLVPLQGLSAVLNGTIRGLGFSALAELPTRAIQPLLMLITVVTLAALDALTAANALWAQLGAGALIFAIASMLLYRVRPTVARGYLPEYRTRAWLEMLLPFAMINLVAVFNIEISVVLLGTLGTDEAVAAQRVAERGAQLVLLSLTLVNIVISPYIVRAVSEDDIPRLQKLSRQSARSAFFIALPIGLVLIIFGKAIIAMVFGDEYAHTAYLPMVVLICGYMFHLMAGSAGILLMMSGHEKLALRSQFIGLLLTVVLSLILIPGSQALGAAVAVTAGVIVYTILQAFSVVRRLRIRPGIF